MRIARIATALVLAFAACCSRAISQVDGATGPTPLAFAQNEWKLFDDGKYREMYDSTFDDTLKRQMTRDVWLAQAQEVARRRGNVIYRTPIKNTNSMNFYRLIFRTHCTEGDVIEDLSFQLTDDSKWRVVAIWVRPDLE